MLHIIDKGAKLESGEIKKYSLLRIAIADYYQQLAQAI